MGKIPEHTRLAASRQTIEKLSVGALVGRDIEEAAHANGKAKKSMTNCLGRVLRPLERAKGEPTSSKISPGFLRTDLRRCGAPPSRPRDTLGTLRDALGMPRGSLRTLRGRSREALGCSRDAPGTPLEQCRSPWAHFWTNSMLNALLNGLRNKFLSMLACHAEAPMCDPSHFHQCFVDVARFARRRLLARQNLE